MNLEKEKPPQINNPMYYAA